MKTKEVKTSELIGAALDWAVAKADGGEYKPYQFASNIDAPFCDACVFPDGRAFSTFRPSSDWSQGGPLIEKYRVSLEDVGIGWIATPRCCTSSEGVMKPQDHDFLLVAAMRAIVAAKLGDVVNVPVELVGAEK